MTYSDETPVQPLTTTNGTVGLVHVSCPACGDHVEVDVRVSNIEFTGGSYFYVKFQREAPKHACAGRRS